MEDWKIQYYEKQFPGFLQACKKMFVDLENAKVSVKMIDRNLLNIIPNCEDWGSGYQEGRTEENKFVAVWLESAGKPHLFELKFNILTGSARDGADDDAVTDALSVGKQIRQYRSDQRPNFIVQQEFFDEQKDPEYGQFWLDDEETETTETFVTVYRYKNSK